MMKRLRRKRAIRAMQKWEKKAMKYHGSIEAAIIANLRDTDQAIYSYLNEPSEREIGRALSIPKSTVHDALVRLRNAGLGSGRWTVNT